MRSVETAIQEIRDVGYTIIPNLIDGPRLRRAQADADALLGPTPIAMPGLDGKVIGRMCKGLFRKSRAFDDLYAHPTVLAVVRGVLADPERKRSYLTFGSGIQLSTVMIKDVQPRENIRHMHRDDGWYPISRPRPPIVVNTLLALDPFTRETGGTLVVPGSHKWTRPWSRTTSTSWWKWMPARSSCSTVPSGTTTVPTRPPTGPAARSHVLQPVLAAPGGRPLPGFDHQ